MAVVSASESLEWRQARQWLITSQVIPVTHRVTKPDVDIVDFARSLRDGVFLCSLLNILKPDCVPESDWTPKPLMQVSQNVSMVVIDQVDNMAHFPSLCAQKISYPSACNGCLEINAFPHYTTTL